jgi:hypothetical protein
MSKLSLDLPFESEEALTDEDLDPCRGAYFPRRFLIDLFHFLKQHEADIEVLTYSDLPWGEDCDYQHDYPTEHRNWRGQLASGERDPNKAFIVLQYDVDSRPERTSALLREPAHAQVAANVMIFNRRIDRRRLKHTGELSFTDYDLDRRFLYALAQQGFVIGYHTNAYEQALFDTERALEIFDRDVRELSGTFNIRFFSAHGGVPGPAGKNNRDLAFHPDWQNKLKWVHNGHSLRFDAQFSDGGHNSPRDPSFRDLRDFVARLRPGRRYRILLHPQYYGPEPRQSPRFSGTPWYDELMEASRVPNSGSLWQGVKLGYVGSIGGRDRFSTAIADSITGKLRRRF